MFVDQWLSAAGDYPAAGTSAWCLLDDDDPRKLAAVLDAGQRHALRIDTIYQELAQSSKDIAAMDNWKTDHLTRNKRLALPKKGSRQRVYIPRRIA